MFDIGDRIHLLFISQFFCEKYIYIVYLSLVYLSLILKSNFLVPRSPEWNGSFLPTKWTRSPFRMLLRSGSSREENKMLLPFPLSFPALLIFPSNAGRAATGAGGRNLREDARLLGPFFRCNTGKRPLFVIPAAFQILYWTHGVARTLQIMFEPMFKPNPPPILLRLERMPTKFR